MIDTIIFDGEGVVVDTERIWDVGQQEFLKRRGFVYDRERIKPLLTGRSLVEGVVVLKREYGFEGDPEVLARERMEIVRELFESQVTFIDGFLKFFERIRLRYKTCIATAIDAALLQIVERRLGLSQLFANRIFTLADVDFRSKPDPALFLHAANALGSLPAACLVIEDSPLGVEAAKHGGMMCIGLATTYEPEALREADQVVASYSEIDLADHRWQRRGDDGRGTSRQTDGELESMQTTAPPPRRSSP